VTPRARRNERAQPHGRAPAQRCIEDDVSRPDEALEHQLVGVALRIGKSGEPAREVLALMHEREIKRNFAFANQNFDSAIGAKAMLDFMNVGLRRGDGFVSVDGCPKSIPRIQVISVRSAVGA
jgi:hypothetical protein